MSLPANSSHQPSNFASSHRIHYDARFTHGPLDDAAQQDAIKVLIQTYLSTFHELGVQTWLMHGTLLGWWWGKKASSRAPILAWKNQLLTPWRRSCHGTWMPMSW